MADTWITDIRHYIGEDGGLADMPAQARNLALYFGSIVAAMTAPPSKSPKLLDVPCRRRPGRKPCLGEIVAAFEEGFEYIVWECPACGDRGRIQGWAGTQWDHRPRGRRLWYLEGGAR